MESVNSDKKHGIVACVMHVRCFQDLSNQLPNNPSIHLIKESSHPRRVPVAMYCEPFQFDHEYCRSLQLRMIPFSPRSYDSCAVTVLSTKSRIEGCAGIIA